MGEPDGAMGINLRAAIGVTAGLLAAGLMILPVATGCAGNGKKNKWETPLGYDEAPEGKKVDWDQPPPAKPKPVPIKQSRGKPVPEDYLITYQDCEALAGNYGRVYRRAEADKVDEKTLTGKALENAQKLVDENTRTAQENWLSECQGIVETPQPRNNLKCAMKARTLQRFNDCMEGKLESESD